MPNAATTPPTRSTAKMSLVIAERPDTLESGGDAAEHGDPRPGWIDEALLAETQRVWSKQYGRDVSAAEATEILLNVRRLARLLVAHRNDAR
ncbi:MAG: hypothetical protein NTW87_03165 [Planctomycetota bacterium]|nr:hypothetical protein [Planctomycetota bacterium]